MCTNSNSADPTAPAAHYELTNHLGNVLAVITPDASDATQPAIESLTDYYPFGMEEPGRSYSAEGYRYGFNGKEKEDANGIHLDFGSRIYDSRVARFLSVDPKVLVTMASYNFAGNSPVSCIDYEGEYEMVVTKSAAEAGINNDKLKPLLKILNCMSEMIEFSGVMKEITKQTGFSEEQITRMFSYEDKSIQLIIRDVDEHSGKMEEDGVGGWNALSLNGGLANGGDGNQVSISREVIEQLNNVLESAASEVDKAAMALAVGLVILHETIHELDYRFNDNKKLTSSGGAQQSESLVGHRPIDVQAVLLGIDNVKYCTDKNYRSQVMKVMEPLFKEKNGKVNYDIIKQVITEKNTHDATKKIVPANQTDIIRGRNRNQRLLDLAKKMISDNNAPEAKQVNYKKE